MTAVLGLGTVQFGLDYGLSNTEGQVSRAEARAVIDLAAAGDIRTLDTAAAYGESEAVLGDLLADGTYNFSIVTKVPSFRTNTIGPDQLAAAEAAFAVSLSRLRQEAVDVLLAHHADDLLVPGGERLFDLMLAWQAAGRAVRIGASVYDPEQAEALLERYPIAAVQLPLNVFDQRFLKSGTLARLQAKGVSVHVRSAFLQGVLLLRTEALPEHLSALRPHHAGYFAAIAEAGLTPQVAALGFVKTTPGVDVALVGVQTRNELADCIDAHATQADFDYTPYAFADQQLLDPRTWPARSARKAA